MKREMVSGSTTLVNTINNVFERSNEELEIETKNSISDYLIDKTQDDNNEILVENIEYEVIDSGTIFVINGKDEIRQKFFLLHGVYDEIASSFWEKIPYKDNTYSVNILKINDLKSKRFLPQHKSGESLIPSPIGDWILSDVFQPYEFASDNKTVARWAAFEKFQKSDKYITLLINNFNL